MPSEKRHLPPVLSAHGKSTTAYLESIDQAVKNGAKVIVTPGFLFEEPVYIAQDQYPDVTFILIDGNPHDADYNYKTADNCVASPTPRSRWASWPSSGGCRDGMTKLGYMGEKAAVPRCKNTATALCRAPSMPRRSSAWLTAALS